MRLERPRGVVPRARGCNLPENFAQKAENINLLSGRFEPWRQPVKIVQFDEEIHSAHVRDCCWTGHRDPTTTYHDLGNPLSTVRSSGHNRPQISTSVCVPDWTYLGYPVPEVPLVQVDQKFDFQKGPDTESRTYRITYGTDCEEGPASCPSEALQVPKGVPVQVLLPDPPEKCWGATHVNLYRSQSLWDTDQGLATLENNPVQAGWTSPATDQQYFLVARLPVSQRIWEDSHLFPTESLLVSEDYLPPLPEAQIAGETTTNSLVAWQDKTVQFSEKNHYWAFPLRSYHDFPYCILDVKVCQDRVFVFTQGMIYVIQDQADCTESSERSVLEVKSAPRPAECLSCVLFRDAVLYTSVEGLVALSLEGSHTLVSLPAFDTDSWNSLGPIRGLTTDDQVLLVSTDQSTLLWDARLDENNLLPPDVTSLSFHPEQWLVDEKKNLYFLSNCGIYQFNAGTDYMNMDWWQAEQRTGSKQRLSTIGIEYVKKKNPCQNTVSVYRDGCLSIQKNLGDKPLRIRNTASDCLQVRVQGDQPMCALSYGQGRSDLRGEI